mmetsp:Transcript_21052/g.50023  ORF Transcript_21052/g.50023 Transcript_21052/m.50023 type:complete len:351 (+) Transcript_21052:2448-3500(+)
MDHKTRSNSKLTTTAAAAATVTATSPAFTALTLLFLYSIILVESFQLQYQPHQYHRYRNSISRKDSSPAVPLTTIRTTTTTMAMTEDSTNNKNSTQGEETTPSFSPSLLQSNPESQAANKQRSQVGILRVVGPDAKGLLAAFSQTLYGHGCGIVESEQHTDHEAKKFFQRLKFDYSTMHTDRNALEVGIREVSDRLNMTTSLNWNEHPKKIAIMVSKYDHALWELLLRHQGGELDSEVSCIISNHPDLKYIADAFKIPFHLFKVTKATKASVEEEELKLLKQTYRVDLVILARYMQIVSDDFCSQFQHQVINIHHSFLPAFIGSKPYHRAYDRGVKLIGATAHYATGRFV